MSDSVEVAIQNISRTDLRKFVDALKAFGFSPSREGWYFVSSPLTKAKYAIKVGHTKGQRIGFHDQLLVSVNVPACTVGNNVLIQNGVLSACKLVIKMLRYQFVSMDLDWSIINKLTLENVLITGVTLTYLFDFENHQEALLALNHLFFNGEVLRNLNVNPRQKNQVYKVGGSEDFTAYFRDRCFLISAYVKSGPTPDGFGDFPSENIESMIYAEGESKLRIEINMFSAMLKKSEYSSPFAWGKRLGVDNPYRFGMELIRKYFRFDERFRVRLPKRQDLGSLSPLDQNILEWHFNGNEVRLHPEVAGDPKKFSALKCRILRALRIDLNIPWQKQKIICGYLSDTLTFNNRYRVPDALQQFSFCKKTVQTSLRKLGRLIPIQQSNRISNDDALGLNIEFE